MATHVLTLNFLKQLKISVLTSCRLENFCVVLRTWLNDIWLYEYGNKP